MKNNRFTQFIPLLFLISTVSIQAQSIYNKVIYRAYVNGDMNKWAAVIHTIEQNQETNTIENLILIG